MCNTYEYEYGFVCVDIPKHKHIYDSLTHVDIILVYNMRHLNFFSDPDTVAGQRITQMRY